MKTPIRRSPKGYYQYSITLFLAVVLSFSTFLTMAPEQAQAGSGVLSGWSGWGFYPPFLAGSGSTSNANVATLNSNTTSPYATSTDAPSGEAGKYYSTGWAGGSGSKFWKVKFSSVGFQNLTVSSQQMSSDLTNQGISNWNGPRDFKLQYSTNDSTWTDVSGGTLTLGSSWTTGNGRLSNLSLPVGLNNLPNVYLRWIMTSNTSVNPSNPTIASDAQSMIAGIYIRGTEIPAAPTDIVLTLSAPPLSSGDPVGTKVGTLSVVDPNAYDTWTYSLVSGTGSTNNAFFKISGNTLLTNATLAVGTYSIRVNVNDGTSDFAKIFTITVVAYPAITGGNTSYGDYITNVTFAGINKTSGKSSAGYEDFTNIAGTVLQGSAYPLSVTVNVGCPNPPVDPGCSNNVYPQYIKAWFDWNQDHDFTDAGEGIDINTNTTSNGPHTITVNVPATAPLGATRMRIVNNADNNEDLNPPPPPDSGTTTFIGEAEDYTINVTGLTITTGAISGSPFYVSATKSASVNVPYAITGTYNAGNVFTAYLSNATGDFTNETAIGSRTATDAGTISATIPAGKASGSGYRIRVKSSNPVITGSDNGVNITITLDTAAPVVTVPANATVEATGPSGAAYTFTATATDAAPATPTVTCNPTSGSIFPMGPTTVTCSATDSVGNTGSSSFTVTVRDTTAPAITVPSNATVEATGPAGAVYTYTSTATDLVGPANPSVTCLPASGSTFSLGATVVTCNASDTAGNAASKTFTVTVQDKTAPVVTVPANATLEATEPSGAVYTFTATATDLVAPANPNVTCSPASGSTFPLGANIVTCSATDTAGNIGSKTFTVTVQDTTAPVVSVPADVTVEATGPNGASYAFTATATDLASSANPTVTCAPASGSIFPLGANNVTCSATDTAGNTGSSTFTVTVHDTTAPVVSVPADAAVEATGPAGAVFTFTATAVDLVAPANPTAVCTPASGSTFPLGANIVTCSATDSVGNTGTSTFPATVRDTTPPAINVPDSTSVEATGPDGAAYTFTATATDLVDLASPTVTCDPASGSTFPFGATEVTCSTADTAGNTASKTFTVTVQDTTGPEITVPSNPTVEATGPDGAIFTFDATAADLVDPASPTVTCDAESGSTFPLGDTTVTCTAADTAGNTTSKTFTVTVQDTTAPVVTVPDNASIEVTDRSGAIYTFTATATDLVDPLNPTVTCDPASGSTFPFGKTTVTCSATDTAGNTGSSTFTVTVWMKTWNHLPFVHR